MAEHKGPASPGAVLRPHMMLGEPELPRGQSERGRRQSISWCPAPAGLLGASLETQSAGLGLLMTSAWVRWAGGGRVARPAPEPPKMGGLCTLPSKLGTHNQFRGGGVPGKRAGVREGRPPETRLDRGTWPHLSFNSSYSPQASEQHKLVVTAATQAWCSVVRCGLRACVCTVCPRRAGIPGEKLNEARRQEVNPRCQAGRMTPFGRQQAAPAGSCSRGGVVWKANKSGPTGEWGE